MRPKFRPQSSQASPNPSSGSEVASGKAVLPRAFVAGIEIDKEEFDGSVIVSDEGESVTAPRAVELAIGVEAVKELGEEELSSGAELDELLGGTAAEEYELAIKLEAMKKLVEEEVLRIVVLGELFGETVAEGDELSMTFDAEFVVDAGLLTEDTELDTIAAVVDEIEELRVPRSFVTGVAPGKKLIGMVGIGMLAVNADARSSSIVAGVYAGARAIVLVTVSYCLTVPAFKHDPLPNALGHL